MASPFSIFIKGFTTISSLTLIVKYKKLSSYAELTLKEKSSSPFHQYAPTGQNSTSSTKAAAVMP